MGISSACCQNTNPQLMRLNLVYPKCSTHIPTTNQIARQQKETIEGKKKWINQYEIKQILGEGSFGKVRLGFDGQQLVAIKIFNRRQLCKKREAFRDKDGRIQYRDALQDVLSEIEAMGKGKHNNVIQLYEVLIDELKDKMYLVMEYAAKGQLLEWNVESQQFYYMDKNRKGFLEEMEIRGIFRQALKALLYLHCNGIIHRDLKPQNILFDKDNNVKLADFGVAVLFDTEKYKKEELKETNNNPKEQKLPPNSNPKQKLNRNLTMQIQCAPFAGTYFFMSPECLDKSAMAKGIRGKPLDIWALGVTLFAFTFLNLPFFAESFEELKKLIEFENPVFPKTRKISNQLKEIFKKIFIKNPDERATLD